MENRDSNYDLLVLLFLSFVGACWYALWKFSNMLHVDMPTGFEVIKTFVVFSVIAWMGVKFRFIASAYILPVILIVMGLSLFPALDYWSSNQIVSSGWGGVADEAWYAAWWGKALIAFGPAIGVLLFTKMISDFFWRK
jgi:hypothetical protein